MRALSAQVLMTARGWPTGTVTHGWVVLAMRIAASSVALSSSHTFSRTETELTRVRIAAGGPRATASDPPGQGRGIGVLERGAPGLALGLRGAPATGTETCDEHDEQPHLTANLRAAIAIVEQLTGRRVQLLRAERVAGELADPATTSAAGTTDPAPRGVAVPNWEVSFEQYRRIEESEHTTVRASASVTTDAGATHEVHLELHMSRQFVQEHLLRVHLTAGGEPVDPLVVTLAPQMASFGDGVMHFDLDLDGQTNQVRMTAGASAYLVDDRDGDGRITDGSELFGPRTGDGFSELAELDEDGNGWIDAGDAAYHRLRLAVADGSGGVTLRGLAESGVAAIGVSAVASPFLVTDADGAIGQIRSTGMVLLESGHAGTVQHVDLLL